MTPAPQYLVSAATIEISAVTPAVQNYRLVYSIADAGYQGWSFLGTALVIVGAGVAMLIYDRRHPRIGGSAALRRVFLFAFILFGITLAVTGGSGMRSEYMRHRQALESGDFVVVEGVVEHFVPAPPEGHKNEEFDVGGRHYSYSDYVVVPAFHQTRSHGGPINEGLQVRIADFGGHILRLEVSP